MYTFVFISIPLLSLHGVMDLVAFYAEQIGTKQQWWLYLPFLQLLSDLGGLPRPVSYFLEQSFGPGPLYERGKVFFENLFQTQCYPIFNNIARAVQDKYGIEAFISCNRLVATQVLRHAIGGIPVRRDSILGAGVAVEEMELDGHVFLELAGDGGWVLFRMPFLFIHIYNSYLSILPHALAQPLSQDTTTYWQDWEKFNAFFEAFVTNIHVSLGTQEMSLGSLFWKAYGTEQTLNTWVKIQKLDVAPLVHQFPSASYNTVDIQTGGKVDWKSGKYLLLNGRGAPFGDTVSFHQRVGNMETIIISGQEKWDYNGKEFTAASAVAEHTKAMQTATEKGLPGTIVTICFTSQPIDNHKVLPGMKHNMQTKVRSL